VNNGTILPSPVQPFILLYTQQLSCDSCALETLTKAILFTLNLLNLSLILSLCYSSAPFCIHLSLFYTFFWVILLSTLLIVFNPHGSVCAADWRRFERNESYCGRIGPVMATLPTHLPIIIIYISFFPINQMYMSLLPSRSMYFVNNIKFCASSTISGGHNRSCDVNILMYVQWP